MRQKLLSLLLSLTALALAGCGNLSAGNVIDIADTILGGEDPSGAGEEDLSPEATPPEEAAPEDPGTTRGEGLLYQGGDEEAVSEEGTYNSAEEVALYLYLYEHLPDNYITKGEARDLGWTGGSVERYAPGCAIGGDRFGNREGLLPDADSRTYYECDIDTLDKDSRGAKRIIYSNDGLIYYTEDHYESFTLLYGEE